MRNTIYINWILISLMLPSTLSAFSQNATSDAFKTKIRDVYRAKERNLIAGWMRGRSLKTIYGKGQALLDKEFQPKTEVQGQVVSRNPAFKEITSEAKYYFAFSANKSYNELNDQTARGTQTHVKKEISDEKNAINITPYQKGSRDVTWFPQGKRISIQFNESQQFLTLRGKALSLSKSLPQLVAYPSSRSRFLGCSLS